MANSLFIDQTIDVVQITLKKKSDPATTVTYSVGFDAWDSGALYSGSPVVYPVLARSPVVKRKMGIWVAERQDVDIEVHGKTHFDRIGRGLVDLRSEYEFHGAAVKVYFYPKASGALTTHSDATRLRQVLECIGLEYDDTSGILTIRCRDTWFKDVEVNKTLTSEIFPNIQADPRGEVGSVVFGQTETVGDGVVVSAPILDSTTGSGGPELTLFAGWTGNSSNDSLKKLYVRNQNRDLEDQEFLEVNLAADCTVAESGSVFAGASYPTNWARDVAYFQRARLYAPAVPDVLTAIGIRFDTATRRCADFTAGSYLTSNGRSGSKGDSDLSVHCWVKFDAVSPGADMYFLSQGKVSPANRLEWAIWLTTGNRIACGISVNGSTFAVTHTCSAVAISAATWYHVVMKHDAGGNTLQLIVNDTSSTATSTGANVMTDRDGRLYLGSSTFDGKLQDVGLWTGLISSGLITGLYNGGSGALPFSYLSEAEKAELEFWYLLEEAYGQRRGVVGYDRLVEKGGSVGTETGTAAAGDTETEILSVSIYDTGLPDTADPSTITPGRLVARGTCNDFAAGEVVFALDPPLPRPAGRLLFYVIDAPKKRELYDYLISYQGASGQHHYYRDIASGKDDFIRAYDIELAMKFYVLGTPTYTAGTLTAQGKHAKLAVKSKNATILSGTSSYANFELKDLEFKISQSGIKDDGGGTYTGSASAVIRRPVDIAYFLLCDPYIGAGLSTGDINGGSVTDVRSLQDTAGMFCAFAIRQSMDLSYLISELCRQGRMRFYKQAVGTLAFKYGVPVSTVSGSLNEGVHRADTLLTQIADADYSYVVNEFNQGYDVDELNQLKDNQLIRRAGTDRYAALEYLTPTSSNDTDTARQGVCSTSQDLYGKRLHDAPYDFHDAATVVNKLQNYMVDRFSDLPRRAVVRLPRKRYYSTIDLFSTLQLQHSGVDSVHGTGFDSRVMYAGEEIEVYDEGVPCSVWSGGTIAGEVVGVEEEGPFITFEIITVGNFD